MRYKRVKKNKDFVAVLTKHRDRTDKLDYHHLEMRYNRLLHHLIIFYGLNEDFVDNIDTENLTGEQRDIRLSMRELRGWVAGHVQRPSGYGKR